MESYSSYELEDGDWLAGRPRTASDAQRHGNEEKLAALLRGTGRHQAFGIGIINQAQPQQRNSQVDAKIDPVITNWIFIQHIPSDAGYVVFAQPLKTRDMQARA